MGNNNVIAKHITNKIKRKIIISLICVIIVLILICIFAIGINFFLKKIKIPGLDFSDNNNNAQPVASGGTSSPDIVQTITGKTYYVSPSGSDSNSGDTESAPMASIEKAINKLQPGDGLIIQAGTYHENKISISKKGEEGKPVIIRGQGEVIFDGRNGGSTFINVGSGANHVNIEGITFKNLKAFETRAIYLSGGCKNINILNCNFENIISNDPTNEDSAANAIYFAGSGSTRDKAIDNVIIKNCTMKNICAGYSEGISIDGNCTNIIVDGVKATAPDVQSNIAICVCGNDSGTNSHSQVNRPEHVQIINCDISDCVSPYGQDSYGIYVDGGYDVTISNNTIRSSTGGIEADAEHTSSAFSGRETERINIQNNTIIKCKKAMYIGGYTSSLGTVKDVTVTNNIFKESGDIYLGKCTNVTFSGNEFNGTGYENDSGPRKNVVKQ